MKIKMTSVYVDDQEIALRFYTEILGFAKKSDFSQGPYRWLTVASPEEPSGTELQLALNNNSAAKAYQQAIFQQGQPAIMFFTDDVKSDYDRISALGAEFTKQSGFNAFCNAPTATTLISAAFALAAENASAKPASMEPARIDRANVLCMLSSLVLIIG